MTTINSILDKVAENCQPTDKEIKKLTTIGDHVKKLISDYNSPKIKEVVFGGSFAKATWIKGDADIDIFVKIDPAISEEEFEMLGKQIGLQTLQRYKPYLRYSDHPYVEAFIEGTRVNVVPCYSVAKGSWKSIADRSPFHTEYVKINLDDYKRKQVRLLKKFLKSAGIYGSEIATNGFSGYVAEVLILKYGSVESVMWAFSEMSKEKNVISIDIVAEDILKTFQSDVIIMDPIDPKRNLGTAISAESLGKFILTARAFLERPSTEFFIVREKDFVKPYTKLDSNLLIVEFTYQKRSPDIIWGQMKRSLNAISQQLELAGFTVIRSTCITDEKKSAAFVFLLESILLPFYTEKKGPAVFRKTDSASFITKNSKNNLPIWIAKDMRITTLVQRKIISAKDYTMVLLTERLERSGVTKGLRQDILLHGHIYTGTELKLKGIVKDAANELLATEPLIFQ